MIRSKSIPIIVAAFCALAFQSQGSAAHAQSQANSANSQSVTLSQRHHHLTARAQVVGPTPVHLAPLGPRPAPFWGSYGARDEVWGSCGHWGAVFSCPGT
jgi:hypothetical protein